ncbi:hypothetical protein [Hyphomicrobium sp. CS1GBMeth3]|uniref:hypothetical protein n=1 Tax=Hyphomicrobium sp. CS1GBMeth3 TaxID=1892845 RepID=UPI0009311536|nr:hypothetical protein [Hyphomicrobium sp. CS1GBMeth3]
MCSAPGERSSLPCGSAIVWLRGTISYLECVAAALATTLIGVVYLLALVGLDGWAAVLTLNLFLGVASVVAALVCRWVGGAAGLLPR